MLDLVSSVDDAYPSSPLLILDHDGQVRWVSMALAQVLDSSPDELVAERFVDIAHHDDRANVRSVHERAMGGQSSSIALRLLTATGEPRRVRANVEPLLMPDGTNGAIVGVSIVPSGTVPMASGWASGSTVGHLESMTDVNLSEREIVLVIDDAERVRWSTSSSTRLLGWAPAELQGVMVADLVHAADRERLGRALMAPTGADETLHVVRVRHRLGRDRWMHISVRTPQGAPAQGGLRHLSLVEVDEFVRDRQAMEHRLAELERVVHALPDPMVVLRPISDPIGSIVDFQVSSVNESARIDLGQGNGQVATEPLRTCVPWLSHPHAFSALVRAAHSESMEPARFTAVTAQPPRRLDVAAVRAEDLIVVCWQDVTEVHATMDRLSMVEREYRLLAASMSDAVVRLEDGVVTWASRALEALLGWSVDDWIGRRYADFVHPDDLDDWHRAQDRADGGAVRHRHRVRGKSLAYEWIDIHASSGAEAGDSGAGTVLSMRSVEGQVRQEQLLDHRARHDPLTGLCNRAEAVSRLDSLSERDLACHRIAIMFCDLDGFKAVNDRFGHAIGDEVLVEVTSRIRRVIRATDFAARMGGDEVLVVLDAVRSLRSAARIADKIRLAAGDPITIHGHQVVVSMSVGLVLAHAGESAAEAIDRADQAMYEAKRRGGGRVVDDPASRWTSAAGLGIGA